MIKDIIKKRIHTSRTPVSKESNQLVQDIADILNAEVLSVKSGSEVFNMGNSRILACKKRCT